MNDKNALKRRILALANRANAHNDAIRNSLRNGDRVDFAVWDKEDAEMEAELNAINEAAGKGLVVGRVLTFGVADGNASYIVTKVRKNDVVVEWVPLGDGYSSPAVGLSADKTEYLLLRSTAEAYSR